MAWVRIDELFYDHPKWATAPGDSIALWLAAMAWCNRNDSLDGFIPTVKLHGLVSVRSVKRTATDLVDRDAFHPATRSGAHGYLIHDYPEYQQPERVREIAAKRSAAGKKGALNRWAEKRRAEEYAEAPPPPEHQANGMATTMANAIANRWPDTVPVTTSSTQESSSTENCQPPVDDDDRFATTLELIVDAKLRGRHGIDKPKAYRLTTRTNTIAEDGALIRRMLTDGDPPDTVAAFVLAEGIGTQQERQTGTPWCPADCPHCGGDDGTRGWVWVDDNLGGLTPCPGRQDATA